MIIKYVMIALLYGIFQPYDINNPCIIIHYVWYILALNIKVSNYIFSLMLIFHARPGNTIESLHLAIGMNVCKLLIYN